MKKQYGVLTVVGMIIVICMGCSNEEQNTDAEAKNTEINLEVSTQLEVDVTEHTEEFAGIVYDELSRNTLVDDADMLKNALDLVLNEYSFVTKLDVDWPEDGQVYEINGRDYLLVEETSSWDYYEEQAETYYAKSYIEEIFTPWYTDDGRIYLEQDGKLYRAMSDGIRKTVISESLELWQVKDELYYITIQCDSDIESDILGYVVRVAEDKPYGFEIVDKVNIF